MGSENEKAAMAQELSFRVTGMSCTGCEDRIVGALMRTDGVRHSFADYRSGQVRVLFDPRETTPQALQARIEAAGYGVSGSQQEPS